jgi:SAM-dependent methyltransferase
MTAVANCSASHDLEPCEFGAAPRLTLETGNSIAPHVEIWQCKRCRHGVTRPQMPDVSPLYDARESQDFLARDNRVVAAIKWVAVSRLARSLIAWGSPPVRVIADYGTGNGMLARALAAQAGEARIVYALDFFDQAPGPLGTALYSSFASSVSLHGQVDILTCFHVLEHDDDSDAMLDRLLVYLRPGGTLIVEVPNVDCVWTPWFGRSCANWYAPFHRVHFSRKSLHGLFERRGLEVIAEQDICGPTFALSFAALFDVKPNSWLFLASAALRPVQWAAERLTRRPSALRMIARLP